MPGLVRWRPDRFHGAWIGAFQLTTTERSPAYDVRLDFQLEDDGRFATDGWLRAGTDPFDTASGTLLSASGTGRVDGDTFTVDLSFELLDGSVEDFKVTGLPSEATDGRFPMQVKWLGETHTVDFSEPLGGRWDLPDRD